MHVDIETYELNCWRHRECLVFMYTFGFVQCYTISIENLCFVASLAHRTSTLIITYSTFDQMDVAFHGFQANGKLFTFSHSE